ncbi:MAG TPA: hypothetical protein VH601_04020 [Bryobacteraceae bacterium]|jgi:hypothetical protein
MVFGAAHAYQGQGCGATCSGGVLLQGIALLTWSMLPGILVHVMFDVMSGASGHILLRESASAASAEVVTP